MYRILMPVDDDPDRGVAQAQTVANLIDVQSTEFERALDRLEAEGEPLNDVQKRAIRDFSEALVNKLLHPKATALRQAAATDDRETVEAWLTLFDGDSVDVVGDGELTSESTAPTQ